MLKKKTKTKNRLTTLFFKLRPKKKHALFLYLDIVLKNIRVHDEVSTVCLSLKVAQYEQGNSLQQHT